MTDKPVVKQRNPLIDAGKGLGILLVVFGHAVQKNIPDFDNIMFRVIYSFHMPLFMLLSGCVAKYGDYRSITKNIPRLVVPFFAWYVVLGWVKWYQLGQRPDMYQHILALLKSPDWGLWFLWVLFLCHCCFFVMSQAQKYIGIIGAAAVFIAVQFIPLNVLGVGLLKWHFVFFVAGFLVVKYKDFFVKGRYYLMPAAAVIYCLIFPYWQFVENDMFLSTISFVPHNVDKYTITFYRYITAFAGIGAVMSLVYFIMKQRYIEIFLTTIGLYTFEIYVSHQMLLTYAFSSNIWVKLATASVNAILLSLGLAYILKKVPVAKTLLYGVADKKLGVMFGQAMSEVNHRFFNGKMKYIRNRQDS